MGEIPSITNFLSKDVIILITLFVIFLGYTAYFGRGRIISLILSFYPTVMLYKSMPFLDKLIVLKGDLLITVNKLVIFIIIITLLNIIINRYVVSMSAFGRAPGLLSKAGLSLGALILVLIFTYSVIDLNPIYDFSTALDGLFASNTLIFYWNIVPLALLTVF